MKNVTDLRKSIDKKEIEELSPIVFEHEIIVIEDAQNAERAAAILSSCQFLGFDTETRPAFSKGESYKVGLLQLATKEQVYLFRLNKCGFIPSLVHLLEEPGIVKIGVGIRDDIRNLQKLQRSLKAKEFIPASFVDMQEYAVKFGIEDKSFSKLMAIIMGVRISKKQQTSNWDAQTLTDAQIRYAAIDAWGSLAMYQRLASGV